MIFLNTIFKRFFRERLLKIKSYSLKKNLLFCGINVRFRGKKSISKPHKCSIGNNVHIGDNAFFKTDAGLVIGNNVIVSRNVTIYTVSHNYFGNAIPYDQTKIKKKVIIKDNVWIGMNVNIAPGVVIGEGAIVALGAVVSKDVPNLAIVGGNPAKILKYRDKDHYEKLISQNRISDHSGKILSSKILSKFKSQKI